MIQLRTYQQEAVNAVYYHLRTRPDTNPCVVIPTGGGKSPVMGKIVSDAVTQWNGRCLLLAHVKELLEQNAAKIQAFCPNLKIGIYSAGLNSRDTKEQAIVAGIQSVYNKADELGTFDLILIDEAHLIPPDGEGMYRTFLDAQKKANPNVRIIGMTATPYRLKGGLICKPENILNEICYEISVRELIVAGFLSKLTSKAGKNRADFKDLHIRGGEFIPEEIAGKMDNDTLVRSAVSEIIRFTQDRKKVLIFATSVEHAKHIKKEIEDRTGKECGIVTGDTEKADRSTTLARFKGEKIQKNLFGETETELKFLVNVAVLTTGFDAPNIDTVVLLRPTNSPGLYYQMVGRGFRLSPESGKTDCLVLDYGDNIVRHGPVDMIHVAETNGKLGHSAPPMRECPNCQAVFMASYRSCPDCGFEIPREKVKLNHGTHAASDGILSTETSETEYEVKEVYYQTHEKRNASPGTPKTLRVDYLIGFDDFQSQWVCPEHEGYARKKFVKWWQDRGCGIPVPETAKEAAAIGNEGRLKEPKRITVRTTPGNRFPEIVRFELNDKSRAELSEGSQHTKRPERSQERANFRQIKTEEDAARYIELAAAEIRFQAKQQGFVDFPDMDPDELEERLAIMAADGIDIPKTQTITPADLTDEDLPF